MYRIRVTNKGNLNAILSNITLNAEESNDVGYYINKDKNNQTINETGYRLLEKNEGVLNPTGDSNGFDNGYVYLTIYYKKYEGQVSPTGDDKIVRATAKFDFVQTNNSASIVTPPTPSTNIVYAYNTDERTIGSSKVTDGVSDYTQLSSYKEGKTWFLKYKLDENNIIQNAWACQKYSFIAEPVCLQADNDTENREILEGLADTFSSNGGTCSEGEDMLVCAAGSLGALTQGYMARAGENNKEFEACSGGVTANCHKIDM